MGLVKKGKGINKKDTETHGQRQEYADCQREGWWAEVEDKRRVNVVMEGDLTWCG